MGIADWVAVVEYAAAFLALVVFVVAYLASSRGRALRTAEGRHLLHFRGSLAAWMLISVLRGLAGPYPGNTWVRDAVMLWFMLAAFGGDWLMLRAQLRTRRLRRATETASAPSSPPA